MVEQVEEILSDLDLDSIPIEALDNVDLSLPDEYEDEIFAAQLLNAVTNYHTTEAERKAMRHQGEHQKAETLAKQAAVYRSMAALIQHEHPNTKTLYKQIAQQRADATNNARNLRSP